MSFSDGCGGQNKNLTLVGLYNELHLSGVYDICNHKFLTRGHTFLKNDSDFAQIKKRKASAKVFVPIDWFSVKPAKIRDLKKMARHHIPHPQRDFYLQMSGEGDGGSETEEKDDD